VSETLSRPARRTEVWKLAALFGTFYFVQGISEPTEGLIAQPVRSLMRSWSYSHTDIGLFGAMLALPWSIKPIYGLLSDFVPIFGSRRRSYLVIASATAATALILLSFVDLDSTMYRTLFMLLVIPTVSVAFCDVVIDALMVEQGQPRGLTGQLQSVQWGAIYMGSIVAAWLGGYLSHHNLQRSAFLICGLMLLVTLAMSAIFVREGRRESIEWPATARALREAAGMKVLWAAGAFLFLWAFSPCSSAVLYMHTTEQLGIDKESFGEMSAMLSAASMVASFGYGFYCRLVPLRWLLHLAVVLGVVSMAAYWGMYDKRSAQYVNIAVGLTYATATMIQLDVAARVCPPQVAATVFAALMSCVNLGISTSMWLGGRWYDQLEASYGPQRAFDLLVGISAVCTGCSWVLVPILNRAVTEHERDITDPA